MYSCCLTSRLDEGDEGHLFLVPDLTPPLDPLTRALWELHQCGLAQLLQTFLYKQEAAQLSQRDRATLCVTEYFTKSLKVIRNNTVE